MPRTQPSPVSPGRLSPFARRRAELDARETELVAREAAVSELERALQLRHDAFVRAVAHQLRTPLATLMVASDALRPEHGELAPGERDELVDILIRQAAKLRSLVDDVVALVDPSEVTRAEQVLTSIRGTLASLAGEYLPSRPVEIVVVDDVAFDATLAVRLLAPLLRNVVDHTPAGTPVRLRGGPHPDLRGTFALAVEDAGPGIDDVTGATEPFRTGEPATRRPSPGLGVGLSVVDALARALGGSLVLGRSALGGLEATVLLPAGGTVPGDGDGDPPRVSGGS